MRETCAFISNHLKTQSFYSCSQVLIVCFTDSNCKIMLEAHLSSFIHILNDGLLFNWPISGHSL